MATVLPACSRLTFIKPDYSKGDYEPVSEPVAVRDNAQVKQRLAAQDRIALASSRLQNGDLDVAEREAKAALQQDPKSAHANTILAAVAGQRGQTTQAGAYYRQAAELAPASGPELNNYGAWLCANGQAAAALPWFERAIADPSYDRKASALANAGACAHQAGQPERAERDLRQALQLDPDNTVALGAMAELAYARGDYFEARAFSERRLAASPANAASLQLASQIENKLGDRAAADRYVRRLRQEFPKAGAADAVETRRP
ncbi:type IV pilus biogenesis/stability protein PilW [Luteimonas cucumeris]